MRLPRPGETGLELKGHPVDDLDNLNYTDPNWAPLRQVIPSKLLDDWMWMNTIRVGTRHIEQYKHRDTRGYLNLDECGRPWMLRFDPNSFSTVPSVARPIPLDAAFASALLRPPGVPIDMDDPEEEGEQANTPWPDL
jgi:hypothetical protein